MTACQIAALLMLIVCCPVTVVRFVRNHASQRPPSRP